MTKIARIALVTFVCSGAVGVWLMLCGCSAITQRATAERQPLSFVGDISFGVPTVEGGRVTIPISFTGGEWLRNSAIVPYRVRSDVSDSEIDVTVTTAVAGNGNAAPPQIVLSGVSPGDYTVFYRDPDGTRHRLSQVVITK